MKLFVGIFLLYLLCVSAGVFLSKFMIPDEPFKKHLKNMLIEFALIFFVCAVIMGIFYEFFS